MDYEQFAPALLGVLGFALQWVRQYRSMGEWVPGVIAVMLAAGAWLLVHPLTDDVRMEVIIGIITVAGYTSSVLGGTFAASATAKSGVSIVPMTNSKP